MKLLNLGCGNTRPSGDGWVNLDNLFKLFDKDAPEYKQLTGCGNYVNHDLGILPLPFEDKSFRGIGVIHLLEHFDLQHSLVILRDCKRILQNGGILRVATPDPEVFYNNTITGNEDWGEKNWWGPGKFMEGALFFEEHKQLLSKYDLLSLLHVAGFPNAEVVEFGKSKIPLLSTLDNRKKFTIFVEAVKEVL